MQTVEPGNKVRIDIPNKDDPDYQHHRDQGEVVDVSCDDAGASTGDERDSYLYCVQLTSREKIDLRWRDIRPVSK